MTLNTSLLEDILARHHHDPEALVEILRDLSAAEGYVTQEMILAVAQALRLPVSKVNGVATFYSMIRTRPRGKHLVEMCQDAPCHVAGGRAVWNALQEALGIAFGETTPDGEWSLEAISCIGLCSVGPVIRIDGEVYGNMTPEKVRDVLARVAAGGEA